MKYIDLKDLTYEEFINENNLYAFVRFFRVNKDDFEIEYEDETNLKINIDKEVKQKNEIILFNDYIEMERFLKTICKYNDYIGIDCYFEKRDLTKTEYEIIKNKEKLFNLDNHNKYIYITKNKDEYVEDIIQKYFYDDLFDFDENIQHYCDLIENNLYLEDNKIKSLLNDFENFLIKLDNVFIGEDKLNITKEDFEITGELIDNYLYLKKYIDDNCFK